MYNHISIEYPYTNQYTNHISPLLQGRRFLSPHLKGTRDGPHAFGQGVEPGDPPGRPNG